VPLPRISLQALEAFERVAQSGSMQIAAGEMGLSISSVSHHVARLEEQLGAALLNRTSRPFVLTREGQQALHHLSKGLLHLRRATSETAISGLIGTRALRIGIVEDFESNVSPELAVILARQMPRAILSIRNILSHEASGLLHTGEIDLAVVSESDDRKAKASSDPLLSDPFVVALPADFDMDPADVITGKSELPFLRFNPTHLLGKQVESHLARNRIDLPDRFVFDSAQSVMAIIASGNGWSIMTPLGFMRAQRFSENVRLSPMPLAAFGRKITLMSRPDFEDSTRVAVANLLREIIGRRAVEPARDLYPWLAESFTLLATEAAP